MANVIAIGLDGSADMIVNATRPTHYASIFSVVISQNPDAAPNDIGISGRPVHSQSVLTSQLMDPLPSTSGTGGPHSYANII